MQPGRRRAGLRQSALVNTCVALLCVFGVPTVRALDIQLFDVSSPPMSAQQLAAFQLAAQKWEDALGTPATVKVNVGFGNLPSGVLGSTTPLMCTHSFTTVRAALVAKSESQAEENVMQMLPASSLPVTDINGSRDPHKITMARANARALGIGTGIDPQWGGAMPNDADGSILFANAFANTFDYDPSDGIAPGKTDFVTVAAHELGHLLGFTSLTDVQDYNPNHTLSPFPLDLWRFNETGGAHDVGLDHRYVTAGPAEYYDSGVNNVSFSQGIFWNDPLCGCCAGGCQASHWRDNLLEQLMDPTLAPTQSKGLHPHDLHALDYIGHVYPRLIIDLSKLKWPIPFYPWWKWKLPWCLTCPPFDFPADYPAPHEIEEPPFEPNLGMVVALNLSIPGMDEVKRTLSGVAVFQDAQPNIVPVLRGLPAEEGQVQLFAPPVPAEILPPTLLDLYLESDTVNGEAFMAHALFSESGAQYEPTLGRFGGYRIPLAIDGLGDGVIGDIDGMMTVELLAADATGIPNPENPDPTPWTIDPTSLENSLEVFDLLALGFCDAGQAQPESEPNNGAATANNLGAVGFATVVGSIQGGDADYFRFTAPSNSTVWITVDTGGIQAAGATSRDSILTLFAADGVTPIERDNDDGSSNGANSTLESGEASAIAGRNLAAGGTYFIRVLAPLPSDVIAPYRLYITVTTGPVSPETEVNDTPATANSLVPPATDVGVRSGDIRVSADTDYYTVHVSGPSILHVSADGDPERDGTTTDVAVDLIHTDGTTVLFSANSSADGLADDDPPAEGYPFLVQSAGTYHVRVRGSLGATGTYNVMAAVCRTKPTLLTATPARGGLVLSWPMGVADCRLQSNGDLGDWQDLKVTPGIVDGRFSVEVPADSEAMFFRLTVD